MCVCRGGGGRERCHHCIPDPFVMLKVVQKAGRWQGALINSEPDAKWKASWEGKGHGDLDLNKWPVPRVQEMEVGCPVRGAKTRLQAERQLLPLRTV